jgi:hypothetical protein
MTHCAFNPFIYGRWSEGFKSSAHDQVGDLLVSGEALQLLLREEQGPINAHLEHSSRAL